MTVADLGLEPVLAKVAVTVTVSLFEPAVGETLSQLASSPMLQVVLEVMLNVPVNPDADPKLMLVGDTFKYCGDKPGAYVQYNEYL